MTPRTHALTLRRNVDMKSAETTRATRTGESGKEKIQ